MIASAVPAALHRMVLVHMAAREIELTIASLGIRGAQTLPIADYSKPCIDRQDELIWYEERDARDNPPLPSWIHARIVNIRNPQLCGPD